MKWVMLSLGEVLPYIAIKISSLLKLIQDTVHQLPIPMVLSIILIQMLTMKRLGVASMMRC